MGEYGFPESSTGTLLKPGLVDSLCTLQYKVALSTATLDSGGWLGLATPGLAPEKKCRAVLGALTLAQGDVGFGVGPIGEDESEVVRLA